LIYNLGFRKRINVSVAYTVKQIETSNVIFQVVEEKTIEASLPIIKNYQVPGDMELGDYSYEVEVEFLGQKISSADTFTVVKPFWTPTRIRFILIIVILISVGIIFYYLRKLYKDWRASKLRYIFPIDPKALPKGELNIGQIAETNQTTSLEMKELKTHILTAGATGSGKSVSAMVIVEELLEKKIPVVVFDPTAQWTGFVRPCKDHDLLNFYGKFGMNPRHVKPYKGMIYEVKDPKVKIDFKKYMNPGEISVFTLNKLKHGEYDQAVKTIVDTIFEQGWEESSGLQMVIVFDEVHRLLEKYGGKGGYVALEKACREFRKWGIGLIMISQVLSDFKEAVKGNVLTEIQLHTKSLGDLQRIEKKFGEDYAKRVTKLEVGVGMVQNPKYNKGKPYFVAFRPTYHSPHKIPDKELEIYKEYEKLLKNIEDKIEKLKKSGKDVFNFNVELNLAKDKLKKGRFRMAKIYIDSLTKSLDREK
jgi:Cdc6-like AAA superfamily ATPase